MTDLLELRGISKSFGGVQALRDVQLELNPGEIQAIVGENGAGKSTLIKIVTGAHRPDRGAIVVQGDEYSELNPTLAKSLGIAVVYQQPSLFPTLSVAENIALALEPPAAWRRIDWRQRLQHARLALDRVGARMDPQAAVETLSMPEQQLVEIARALQAGARVLILDEPTASLSNREVDHLFEVLLSLREHGVGIIYISHRLAELSRIADRVTVLRDGRYRGTYPMQDVTHSQLVSLMVGRDLTRGLTHDLTSVSEAIAEAALELQGVSCRSVRVHDVWLEVRRGEILGLAGLVGAGRTELAQVVFGLEPADAGTIRIHGQTVRIGDPRRAIELGIAYLPEDRRQHGVILEMPVAANISLASLERVASGVQIDGQRERRQAERFVKQLQIKTDSVEARVQNLSGGNQQKVALAKWLATEPSILILDEPTQGIDVGSKGEIHQWMRSLARSGMAILMISSDLPEILAVSDRIGVMREGRLEGILSRGEATEERILSLAVGSPIGRAP
ncbi:MAG: sugar ABC transporter ATP-binding protein [Pirellulales bacterium]